MGEPDCDLLPRSGTDIGCRLSPRSDANPSITAHLAVWRSVRSGGDTKMRKSKRTLALPRLVVAELKMHKVHQEYPGLSVQGSALAFTTRTSKALDPARVRRAFRTAIKGATEVDGLVPAHWIPQELRHSFVSLLSDRGVPIEHIAARESPRPFIGTSSGRS
jgi:integrase